MPVYLDMNATTPVDSRVRDLVVRFMEADFGNAGSRTHEYGAVASRAVEDARRQVATAVAAKSEEVVFTSGTTESNNLAILGLAAHGESTGRKHIVSTSIEHKAVIEPIDYLRSRGFSVDFVPPNGGGWVEPDAIASRVRKDTLLVSVMQVNNETGISQPLEEIAALLSNHDAFFHVDAAQGFGKEPDALRNQRIDLISVSGHKLFAPKGVGALIARRKGTSRIPLRPLMFGGGQERGLRPGTLPVALVAGLGLATELAIRERAERKRKCLAHRERVLAALLPLDPVLNGDPERCLAHVVNLSFPGLDSEALMLALKDEIAISNGSACTSHEYKPSHVLKAMQLKDEIVAGAVRISWSHQTDGPAWDGVARAISQLF